MLTRPMLNRWTRRAFGKIAGLTALGLSARASAADARPGGQTTIHPETARRFPDGFLWGTATSAYQVEGAVGEDGRGPSIWDRFAHTPGKVRDNDTADVSADHFHRHREDVAMIRDLGAKAYRFSIAWPRLFPQGTGVPNPKGLDFYDRLIDELLANGIEPFPTLYHWDLPQALQDRGGWESRDTAKAFADYAGCAAERLSDRVRRFITTNEISAFVELGYGTGVHAPGLTLPPGRLNQVRHHAVLGHGLAVRAIRAHGRPGTMVGPAESMAVCVPVIETPEHIRAAALATRERNAGCLTVMMEGRYTDAYLATAGADAPAVTADDLAVIASPVDFVGINVYTPTHYVRAIDAAPGYAEVPFAQSHPRMASEWLRIGPEALYWGPRHLADIWKATDILITENGCAAADMPEPDGTVYDTDRVMFLRSYLTQLQRATSEGVPVRGYFLWSLMDNFEWAEGFATRFGLHHVDYESQRRTPKLSASFYRAVIAQNRVV
ncbi:GH1 family beta-glucosidase [Azospirillum rugosum]|uniref:Beta-glucosidase n=1 Tax=Azospirillum rugosum TaxID=416170 RepID=A0ABS4SIG8_9PROT|nr:GH1 family beta-glucosidase [Azospirillum rugosum]MBP2291863.1 beta-glucosidase [Azospirillum rugosum]MDQ0524325.1 beta-glucosidase [Azospirillum rugosum]